MITMQKVAWPTMMVQRPKLNFQKLKNEFSAIPVMMPGSARGRTKRNEIASRPKKRNRCTANAAAEPRRMATIVAPAAAFSDRRSACCISPSWMVGLNHFVVQSVIGQPCAVWALKA
jgi:hypothetical protein